MPYAPTKNWSMIFAFSFFIGYLTRLDTVLRRPLEHMIA